VRRKEGGEEKRKDKESRGKKIGIVRNNAEEEGRAGMTKKKRVLFVDVDGTFRKSTKKQEDGA